MIIKLSRPASGREILEAFKKSGFEETPTRRFRPRESIEKFQCLSESTKPTPRTVTVTIDPEVFRKTFYLFGKKRWRDESFGEQFSLTLELDKRYEAVDLKIYYEFDFDQGGFSSVCTGPEDDGFEYIQSAFEKIVSNFHSRLSQAA